MKNTKNYVKILIWSLVVVLGAILILVGLSVGNISKGLQYGLIIPGAIVAIVGICGVSEANRKRLSTCSQCGSSLEGCSYQYQEIRREAAKGNSDGYYVYVHIIVTCDKCGTQKEFNKKFYCQPGDNPQFEVDQYCRNLFGH